MALNLASIFDLAKTGVPVAGTAEQQKVYTPVPNADYNSGVSDVQQQQAGVPQWIQNALGINAQSMSPEELAALNDQYGLTRTRNGRDWNYNLTDQAGTSLGTHQYYDAPFNVMNDLIAPAALIYGGGFGLSNLLAGAGGAVSGGLSGMDLAADAALGTGNNIATAGSALGGGAGTIAGTTIPQFQQLPGYGEQFGGPLAQAGNGSPYTLGGEVGGTGLAPSQAGAATGSGFNFSGAAPGSVVGTGEGLGIASGAAGGIGAGLGAGIGASIPTGSALAGTSLGGAGAGSGSGLASQFLGNAAPAAGGGILDAIKTIPGATGMGNSVVGKLLGSVLGGSSGGISGLGNLGSLLTNYNQYDNYKDLIGEIKGIYSPEGQYAKYLEQQLGRRDAAAGRNSQYGPRLAEMMGRLGDSQARALSGLGPMLQGQQGGLNGMVGAGQRLLDGAGGLQSLWNMFSGGGGGSQGGMIPTPTTNGGQYIPNPEYNPVDDNWWTNPQAGP